MKHLVLASLMAMAMTTAARAEVSNAEITVSGVGVAERPAEWGKIQFSIRGEGDGPVDALRKATALQATIEDRLSRLVGASRVKIEASHLEVIDVRGPDCEEDEDSYDDERPVLSEGDCAVAGRVAVISMHVTVWPAERAGDLASLAAELGGANVSIESWGLDSPRSLEDAATRSAMEHATADAAAIANAAGVRLGPVLRVQDASPLGRGNLEEVMVTAQARKPIPDARPTVSAKITVPQVRQQRQLTVVFELAR